MTLVLELPEKGLEQLRVEAAARQQDVNEYAIAKLLSAPSDRIDPYTIPGSGDEWTEEDMREFSAYCL